MIKDRDVTEKDAGWVSVTFQDGEHGVVRVDPHLKKGTQKTIFSLYLDAREQGDGQEAMELIQGWRATDGRSMPMLREVARFDQTFPGSPKPPDAA